MTWFHYHCLKCFVFFLNYIFYNYTWSWYDDFVCGLAAGYYHCEESIYESDLTETEKNANNNNYVVNTAVLKQQS